MRGEGGIALGLSEDSGTHDDLAARLALVVVALLGGEQRRAAGFEFVRSVRAAMR